MLIKYSTLNNIKLSYIKLGRQVAGGYENEVGRQDKSMDVDFEGRREPFKSSDLLPIQIIQEEGDHREDDEGHDRGDQNQHFAVGAHRAG